ncbi:hypothetical protein O6H91_09G117300 [Diphasiastrum complanatum]|uniref:Uncharacterized protein n=1 Tax=Diphasiastrum complanatum TaxID=34168 RepID=A0ACC2CTN4_DIPCM|nr:hypothetical protein O6H91_09G117300 [Diphasiastrum complanatum]
MSHFSWCSSMQLRELRKLLSCCGNGWTFKGSYMFAMSGCSNTTDYNCLQRVKVYRLNDEGRWDDKGTGHISVELLQRSDSLGLVVIDETNNATLLVHRISVDDIYRRQEDTIISWTDSEVGTDLALSFQEAMGCSYIWDQLCSVQRSVQFPPVGATENGSRPIIDELEHSGTSQDDDDAFQDSGSGTVSDLPPMELAALPQIVKFVAESIPMDRDRIAVLILREQNYIRKLLELFRVCEDLENIEGLHMIFKIVKGIISLNDGHIFDILFSDEYIMDVVGALEYDPEFPSRQDHRGFVKEQVVFKEAVPINDPAILSKIHQTYRIGYIKDVILPRALDDQTLSTINSMMLFNNMGVVSSLHNDSAFINALFSKLKSSGTPERIKKELVLFLQELCNISKNFQPSLRSELFSSLVREGLFDIVTTTLQSSDESLPLSGSDILIVISNHDPFLLRTFLVQQQGHTMFSLLVTGILTPGDGGLQAQLLEIMRMLLDSDTMERQTDKSTFLEIFYEKYMDQLVEVFTTACPSKGTAEGPQQMLTSLQSGKKTSVVSPEILGHLCELICFCVKHHGFRIKYYVIRNNLVEKILRLTRRKEKYLVVAAVRFLRACVGLKHEFYYRYLVKHNLFEPVIQAFLANGSRYNLLNSAVLELIEFICKANIRSLIMHLVESYSEKFAEIDYVGTFQQLKLRYEQLLEGPAANSREAGGLASTEMEHLSGRLQQRFGHAKSISVLRERKDERALDKQEEDYFNEDSDDEDSTSFGKIISPTRISPAVIVNGSVLGDASLRDGPFGLVDYEDEDEDVSTPCFEKKDDSLERHPEGNAAIPVPFSDPTWPATEEPSFSKRKTSGPVDTKAEDSAALKKQKQENLHGRRYSDWGSMRSRDNKHSMTEKRFESNPPVTSNHGRSSQKVDELKETKENKSSNDCPPRKLADGSQLSLIDSSYINVTREKRAVEKIIDTSDEISDCGNGSSDCVPRVLGVPDEGRLGSESKSNSLHSIRIARDSKPVVKTVIDKSREVDQTSKGPPVIL